MKEAVLVQQSFRVVPGPGTSQVVQATETGIDLELKEEAAHQANAARETFDTGQANFAAGRYRQAAEDYQRSIAAMPTLSAILNRGLSLRYLPDFPAAEAVLRAGLRLASDQHRELFEGHFGLYLSSVLIGQDKYGEADLILAKTLKIYERLGDGFGQANAHLNIGIVAQSRVSDVEANIEWRQAFKGFARENNILGQANVTNNLAGLYLRRLELVAAASEYKHACALYEQIPNQAGIARASSGLANVYVMEGRLEEALRLSRRALDIAMHQDNKEMRARALSMIGFVRDEQGRFEDARDVELAALQFARDIGASDEEAFAHELLASAFSELGRPRDARDHAISAIEIYKRAEDPAALSGAFNQLGIGYLQDHRLAEAADAFNQALATAGANRPIIIRASAWAGLGMTEAALGHGERALKFLSPAHDVYSRAGIKLEISRMTEQAITRLRMERHESRN